MSTIASPRDPSTPLRRTPSGVNSPTTGSARPSIESLHPPPLPSPQPPQSPQPGAAPSSSTKRNRTALREYYNLRRNAGTPSSSAPVINEDSRTSEVAPSEIDAEGFDAQVWVNKKLAESSLDDLLRLYTGVLGEIRALDAEKKALVYDNYSKLITATETIRKVRSPCCTIAPPSPHSFR